MYAALIVITMLGCFSLPRWYGFVNAAGVLGLCWAVFAWASPFIPYTAPVLCLVVAALVGRGLLRERSQRA